MATYAEAVATLDKLLKRLAKRRESVETLSNAYNGQFNLAYASEDFREFFGDRYKNFADNWCGIVADAPHERLAPTGIRLDGQEDGDKELWNSWLDTESDVYSDLAFLDAIIAKRAYALVWADEDQNPTVTWEHPSQCIVGYDPETRKRVAGAKFWVDDGTEYATLYLPNEIWKFKRSTSTVMGRMLPSWAGGWDLREQGRIPNPLGRVNLVEVANRPRLIGEPMSDIAGALAMQNAANLFWAQLFAASDEATLGQRVILGAEMPKVPILNEEGIEVGERPIDLKKFARDRALWLEDPGTKIAQWAPAKLEVFTDVIEIMVGHIAAQTRTPAHYLLIGGAVSNVSGDAMKALETGLVKRTEEKTIHFGRALREVFELIALVRGDKGKAEAVRRGEVLWKDVENRSDAQRADSLSKKRQIGYPLRYLLELDGLPPEEITRVMAMVTEEATDPIMQRLMGKLPEQQQSPDAGPNGVTGDNGDTGSGE